jgi:hypothetical protein
MAMSNIYEGVQVLMGKPALESGTGAPPYSFFESCCAAG